MNLSTKMKIIGLFIILLIAIIVVPRLTSNSNSRVKYKSQKVDRNDITSQISTTGNINPLLTIDVGTMVAGKIDKVYVDYNSEVKKGDLLATLYQEAFKIELESAEADKKKAEAEHRITKSLYETNKKLFKKSLISKEEFENSSSKYSSTLALYEQSKVALKKAGLNLEKSVIRSPIDGIVLSRNADSGQQAIPDSKPLFVIAQNLKKMKIDTNMSEVHIGKVKKGHNAYFRVDAYPGKVFNGIVSQVRNEPIINNNIVTYNVVVLFENENLDMKPGMTAEVYIITADKKDVMRVPTAALRFIPPQSADIKVKPDKSSGNSHVWTVLKSGQLAAVAVKPGKSDGNYTEVLESELKEGQGVIVESSIENRSGLNQSYIPQPGRF